MAVKVTDTRPIDISIVPDTSAYATNDVIGGKLTFSPDAKKGIIQAVSICDDDNEGAQYVLWLFSVVTTTIADNAPFAPVLADLNQLMGRVTITTADYVTVNSLKSSHVGLSNQIEFNNNFEGYLVSTDTPTFAASKQVNIRLHIIGQN